MAEKKPVPKTQVLPQTPFEVWKAHCKVCKKCGETKYEFCREGLDMIKKAVQE